MKIIEKADRILRQICIIISVFMCMIMIGSGTVQIITRFIFNHSFGWTEELCRYAAIWMVMFMASLAVRERSHISLDCLNGFMGNRGKRFLDKVSNLTILIFSVVLLMYSTNYAVSSMTVLTPGLLWPYGLVRMAFPLSSAVAVFYSLYNLIFDKKYLRE